MPIWQADFYRRPLKDETGQPLWELLLCDETRDFEFVATCPQSRANADWLAGQLRQAAGDGKPDGIWVFRPQCLSLLEVAGERSGIAVEATRRTPALKRWLRERADIYPQMAGYTGEATDPAAIEKPPPTPLPEDLWGDRWRFATLPAGEIEEVFGDRPMPFLEMPPSLIPLNLGLASTVPISGVVIDGGRQSMQLATWLAEAKPVGLNYVPGPPDGLILEAGLCDRWVVATFEDEEVAAAARMFETRKQLAKGLHFLLVRPDDSGMTYTGFWLLGGE
ncbi:Tab2/Atab2 family RNA-binding protein [Lyngbya sp. CCY1209]|uniref:Tab2/Atab2 family RNA-binding protein n=1 Tax=Lyngbya sp. CCY1209 TaxID=2886103 RepID=UPI002D20A97F|nr:Tab2/Atab2 family RNA-binding protein [Lyngbya sp. CCY1209]MEB3886849.1 Tab2/Atab2 family RNA-binding protein [Lyngbya sp. CCY1209]